MTKISTPALREEGDLPLSIRECLHLSISTPALREEGDFLRRLAAAL